ncbi:hypothetical protein OZX65_05715 [Leuconostocaceae bacterium ESL0723]|nr:hypothetical protein OZX65_05715 [Leuconostocaceae bacterium ESL0723]
MLSWYRKLRLLKTAYYADHYQQILSKPAIGRFLMVYRALRLAMMAGMFSLALAGINGLWPWSKELLVLILAGLIGLGLVGTTAQLQQDWQQLGLADYFTSGLFTTAQQINWQRKLRQYYQWPVLAFVLATSLLLFILALKLHDKGLVTLVAALAASLPVWLRVRFERWGSRLTNQDCGQKSVVYRLLAHTMVAGILAGGILIVTWWRVDTLWQEATYVLILILIVWPALSWVMQKLSRPSVLEDSWERRLASPYRDFVQREFIPHLPFLPYLILLAWVWPQKALPLMLILVALLIFLYTPFNNRYWLNQAIYDYLGLLGDDCSRFFSRQIPVLFALLTFPACVVAVVASWSGKWDFGQLLIAAGLLAVMFAWQYGLYRYLNPVYHQALELLSGLSTLGPLILGMYWGLIL